MPWERGGGAYLKNVWVSGDAQQQFFDNLHSVFSDVNILDWMGWNTPRFAVNMIIVGIVAASIIVSIVFALRRILQKRYLVAKQVEDLFWEQKQRCGLTSDETELLQSMLKRRRTVQPHVVFQSLKLFEECVDAEVRSLFENRINGEEMGARGKLLSELRLKMGFLHLPYEYPLASTRNISVGQTGSLFSMNNNTPLFRKVSVVDNTPFFFTVRYNVDTEDVHRLDEGQAVRLAFARHNDGLYGTQVTVAKADRQGSIDLRHTLDMKRNQLRQYVRIETSLPLRFRLIRTENPEKSEAKIGEQYTAKLSDVSGGGLSFLYERSLRLGDIISLNFDLPGAPCAGIIGKIVHLSLRGGTSEAQFKIHVQFINIESRKQEKIISYIFEKERHISQWR